MISRQYCLPELPGPDHGLEPVLAACAAIRAMKTFLLFVGFLGMLAVSSFADEGMWLFSDPPRAVLKERHGFEVADDWLVHLQKSSVRFNSGGSGSFASADGLIITNQHVGADMLQKISTKERDYVKDGFLAASLAEEIKAPDLELNVLMSIEDVTERVNSAVVAGSSDEAAFLARRSVIAQLEKDSQDKTGLRSEVVTLFQGGKYHLYRFKRYTDVRLVFAPERQIAFFGGDPDNFEFPRYDLDVCFFRAYENGKPAATPDYLKWNPSGTKDGDLVFVSGHPGHTSRLLTKVELEYARDVALPRRLQELYRTEVALNAFSSRSLENARRAKEGLFGVQNSRKALEGRLAGLLDPELVKGKAQAEKKLREGIAARENLRPADAAFERVVESQKTIGANDDAFLLLEGGDATNSELFGIARTLVRSAAERAKPNGERLEEFSDASRESLELDLFSDRPIYPDVEELMLAKSLTYLAGKVGAASPLLETFGLKEAPAARARSLVRRTQVGDVAFRRKLYDGGRAAIDASDDPMIKLAVDLDQPARSVRQIIETQEEVKRQAHAQIAVARFAIEGPSGYPDATFTLRLAFGTVKGVKEDGEVVPPFTTFAGLFERAANQENRPPFDLPATWIAAKEKLNLSTPFNFISTADITGGNSGSPVVNRAGEFVGIIFDGNRASLALEYAYEDRRARAVSVDVRGILEALKVVYRAEGLVGELEKGRLSVTSQ
jgi:hypothetical protein